MDQYTLMQAIQTTKMYKIYEKELFTFGPTELPYIFLAALSENKTKVREGIITVDKPIITSPDQRDIYQGWGDYDDGLQAIAIDWGGSFMREQHHHTPRRYVHKELKIYGVPQSLDQAIDTFKRKLGDERDDETGIITGRDDLWAVSLVLYTTAMMCKSIDGVITELREKGMLPDQGLDFS